MSWKCDIVTDLAPLYHDGLASEASEKFVKEHIKKCPDCRAYYKKYRPVEGIKMETPVSEQGDFLLLAKQMRRRRLLLWGGFLAYVSATVVVLVTYYLHKNR